MDAILTIERTKGAIKQRFEALIDMSDKAKLTPEDRRAHFLSRGLAALAVQALTEADPQGAAGCITDGHDDLGLDAIYFETSENTLYVVQSKWSEGGTKTIDLGECLKFLEGVRYLMSGDFSKGNDKLRKRESEIGQYMRRSEVRITLVIVHTGSPKLGDQVQDALTNFVSGQNNINEDVVTVEVFDLARVYKHLNPDAGRKIDLSIGLSWWGIKQEPYESFYGQVRASDVADWRDHGKVLLHRNLRFYRGSTEVNNAMEVTLSKDPESFWYFNNGITILCDKIAKAPLNGKENDWGVFDCKGVSIVNGAQTVGVIWERARQTSDFFQKANASIHLRIISLENCPPDFGQDVTRATNTQNEIRHRDFSALDDTQQRIAHEMALDGRRYAYKSGDEDPKSEDGCNIEEATIALACSNPDVTLAVAAKREIGSLWKDISKHPYTTIFNEQTNSRHIWRAVIISRAVDDVLRNPSFSLSNRGDQILVHGNRFILHAVFQDPRMKGYRTQGTDSEITALATEITRPVFERIVKTVNERHPGAYLQPLFKNAQKCRDILSEKPDMVWR